MSNEQVKHFAESLELAQESEKWMAAVWEVSDGKLTLTDLTTSAFPRGDFLMAISQLAGTLAKDARKAEKADKIQAPTIPEPLPRAVPDIKVFPALDPVVVPAGFPVPAGPTPEEIEKKQAAVPKINVHRVEGAGVIISAEGHLPVALPIEVTEAQITETVETYRAGIEASQ